MIIIIEEISIEKKLYDAI